MVPPVVTDEVGHNDSRSCADVESGGSAPTRIRCRRDMGSLVEAYQEVARGLGIIPDSEQPEQ